MVKGKIMILAVMGQNTGGIITAEFGVKIDKSATTSRAQDIMKPPAKGRGGL